MELQRILFRFKKPGFRKRQSEKLKDPGKRYGIMVDCGLNNDTKIVMLHKQKDPVLLGLWLEILFNLDVETEIWEVRGDHFFQWVKTTFETGNRFNLIKRLEWLSQNGLIEFHQIPIAGPFQCQSPLISDSYNIPTPTELPTEHPFGMPLELLQSGSLIELPFPISNQATKQENKYDRVKAGISSKEKKCKGFPEEVKTLVREFQDLLKCYGVTVFAKDWLLTSYSSCNSLMKQGKTSEEIRKVMKWAVEEWRFKETITHFKHVATVYAHWERENSNTCNQTTKSETVLQQEILNNRKQWFRLPYAVPKEYSGLERVPIISTKEYQIIEDGPPWQVCHKENLSEFLDIREWDPVSQTYIDALKNKEVCNYAG